MTNKQRSDFLIREAKECIKDTKRAVKEGLWNRAVRRAQETVELSLKAVLKLLNVEYPKIHNIAPSLESVLREKNIDLGASEMERVKQISRDLCEKRAPAFYGEKIYSKEDAVLAYEGAEFVLDFCTNLIRDLS